MDEFTSFPRRAFAAAACATALAACGGSSAHKSHQTARDAFLAFSQCMRSHGVPKFPDPGSGGGRGAPARVPNGP